MMSDRSLIIFIKNPESGKAKTRIGKVVGYDKSMEVYLALLNITNSIVKEVKAKKWLFYSDFINEDDNWSNEEFIKERQSEGDLGVKMKDAFSKALEHSSKVIIVGSDCPYLTSALIEDAYCALDEYDTVIGPADDGGYYLLGMKELHAEVFDNMIWSKSNVFSITEQRLKSSGKTIKQLTQLSDIDYWDDWLDYIKFKA